MRIIGGEFGGLRFNPPAKNWPTRPTTDIAKEGLFNILQNEIDFDEMKALDIFGGTGNHSYELISRGCPSVTYVDKFRGCIEFVTETAAKLKIEDRIDIRRQDAKKFIKTCGDQFTYIFAGPPYPLPWLDDIPDLIFDHTLLASGGLFILEHNPTHNFQDHPQYQRERNYGSTIFSFFQI